MFPPKVASAYAKRLIKWWKEHKRTFPWRSTHNPYHILISELLLRKTDAAKVARIYDTFFSSYSSITDLANADARVLSNQLKPLGLYKTRAHSMISMAKIVVEKHGGRIPATETELTELSGVGKYCARAVLCFAYEKNVGLVDANFIRIAKRVFNFKSPKRRPHTDKQLWKFADELVPSGQAKEYNYAILDFANLVCSVKHPHCSNCPVKKFCKYLGKL